jgi:hypothetical protein
MSQALNRRAMILASAAVPALAAIPASAATSQLAALEREYARVARAMEDAHTDREVDVLCDQLGEAEDRIRLLSCTSADVALAHLKIVARDCAVGVRMNAAVTTEDLAAAALAFLGERV